MKFKVADQPEASQDRRERAYVNLTRTVSEPLINIPLSFSQYRNSSPVSAIVDTGSQLNIISKEVCDELMFLLVNKEAHIRMHDANGGEGELIGLIEDIQLQFGGITTWTSLYIGENLPFSMLLGRPWQRGNFVGIDERKDGTYLQFKDLDNLDVVQFEAKVADAEGREMGNGNEERPSWIRHRFPISESFQIYTASLGNTLDLIRKPEIRSFDWDHPESHLWNPGQSQISHQEHWKRLQAAAGLLQLSQTSVIRSAEESHADGNPETWSCLDLSKDLPRRFPRESENSDKKEAPSLLPCLASPTEKTQFSAVLQKRKGKHMDSMSKLTRRLEEMSLERRRNIQGKGIKRRRIEQGKDHQITFSMPSESASSNFHLAFRELIERPSSQLPLAFEVHPHATLLDICERARQEDIRLSHDGETYDIVLSGRGAELGSGFEQGKHFHDHVLLTSASVSQISGSTAPPGVEYGVSFIRTYRLPVPSSSQNIPYLLFGGAAGGSDSEAAGPRPGNRTNPALDAHRLLSLPASLATPLDNSSTLLTQSLSRLHDFITAANAQPAPARPDDPRKAGIIRRDPNPPDDNYRPPPPVSPLPQLRVDETDLQAYNGTQEDLDSRRNEEDRVRTREEGVEGTQGAGHDARDAQASGGAPVINEREANNHRGSGRRMEKRRREHDENNAMDVDGEYSRGAQGSADAARLDTNCSSAEHSSSEGSTDKQPSKRICGTFYSTTFPFGIRASTRNTIRQANGVRAQPATDNSGPRDPLSELERPGSRASSNNAGSGSRPTNELPVPTPVSYAVARIAQAHTAVRDAAQAGVDGPTDLVAAVYACTAAADAFHRTGSLDESSGDLHTIHACAPTTPAPSVASLTNEQQRHSPSPFPRYVLPPAPSPVDNATVFYVHASPPIIDPFTDPRFIAQPALGPFEYHSDELKKLGISLSAEVPPPPESSSIASSQRTPPNPHGPPPPQPPPSPDDAVPPLSTLPLTPPQLSLGASLARPIDVDDEESSHGALTPGDFEDDEDDEEGSGRVREPIPGPDNQRSRILFRDGPVIHNHDGSLVLTQKPSTPVYGDKFPFLSTIIERFWSGSHPDTGSILPRARVLMPGIIPVWAHWRNLTMSVIVSLRSFVERQYYHPRQYDHSLKATFVDPSFQLLLTFGRLESITALDWCNPLMYSDESYFIWEVCWLFEIQGRHDFAKVLHRFTDIHFADDLTICHLVNNHFFDPSPDKAWARNYFRRLDRAGAMVEELRDRERRYME
ncbi:hypothetical protein HETIRDRAFT_307664 [Heterobasidion irregulare TC 32-1]|uniref:Uncharacterized protein n=1 Tax=Heterobasidion irregulare (strain TC 32-1) TaxID=747525 RepID=W4KN67_HETIT|nr:uncharacterized protein HETIRDRAFT_307664 [Heterobasidion irregulare TC 32-1]ETW86496.1 hypothetical protein HETIRDRAFT_307664 [Heterobasidion irregulare TC 32-1]